MANRVENISIRGLQRVGLLSVGGSGCTGSSRLVRVVRTLFVLKLDYVANQNPIN